MAGRRRIEPAVPKVWLPRALGAMVIAALLSASHAPSAAQVAVGARYGQGSGITSYHVLELYARVHAAGPLHVRAAVEGIGGMWGCPPGGDSPLLCGYDGRSVSLGPDVALLTSGRFRVAARGAVGWFERTGTHGGRQYTGSDYVTVSAGLDGAVAIVGPLRLEAAVTHRRILDAAYRDATGELPHLTALLFGLALEFGVGER